MNTPTDSRGRDFTNIVTKTKINAVIQTVRERIEGTIYVFPSRRLLDEVNIASGFIAVTGARIIEGNITQTVDFVAVSVNHIVWMLEVKDEQS
ncbi:MAG: hypothetical protein A2Z16_02420 [Chloroflexi bacterium RBG_16_54_18]|nr:MAG: hypothetical protein A2Z16_02420 [Chloroflexi bacterium RBG_16_54_18]